ncbi:hypothetical protein EMCRGX_G032268 [Ephydatia muelleri]
MELVSQASGIRYEIAEGEHTVGRGPWLQITDKRVSRDHAVIRAENGTLALCPKHKNPCYYGKVGGAKLVPLCKDVWQNLSHGDTISLLHNDLVFKVVMKAEEEGRDGTHTNSEVTVRPTEKQAACPFTDDALFGPADAYTPLDRSGDHPRKGAEAAASPPLRETATDPGGKSPCGETATDPGGKSPCGETATDPGGKSPCGETATDPGGKSPCGETATDPGGKSPCGETATDPGGKSPCGETATDPGGKSPCGETATDPGGKSPCGETATDPGGKSPCGETATDPGGKSPCGETATDPGGKSPCGETATDPGGKSPCGETATDPGGKSPCGETATDPGGKSPCAQPSHDCTAIYAEEPCKPTQPVDRSIDMCVRQHSTSKPRALPSWLTDIEVESKPPKKKAKKADADSSISTAAMMKPGTGKKAGGQSQESGDKPKAKSHEEKPHPPAKVPYPPAEVADLTVDRATIPEAVPKEIKGVDRVTKPGPGSMESTAGPGSMESTAGPGSMESTAATKPPSSLPVCPYGDKCYRKNPAHFREFSHTAATPSGGPADEKPECPYGTDCYRQNPTHRTQYKHSAPPKQRSKRQSVKRPNKRSVLEGDSDEDDQPNTYDYTDSFIDDEQEGDDSSSYGEEDDDMDWVPDNDSEDVAELVSDAKSFLANKKLHKPS